MSQPSPSARYASAFVEALVALGVRHAVVSPGSRNAPVALAAAAHPDLRDTSVVDERSAGFVALGVAKATRRPTLVTSTSGTAAANYLPAVAEARLSRSPLIVVTADRPPELQGVGAPQTIDQSRLYGSHVKAFFDPGPPTATSIAHATALASQVVAVALDPPAGPVHVDLPFPEPLVFAAQGTEPLPPRPVSPVLRPSEHLEPATLTDLMRTIGAGPLLVVAGAVETRETGEVIAAAAAALAVPLFADPLSGARFGKHPAVIAHADLLAAAGALDRAAPAAVVRFGAIPTSKPVWSWLAAHPEVPQVVVDGAEWRDPTASARLVVRAAPTAVAAVLPEVLAPDPGFHDTWRAYDALAGTVVDEALAGAPFPNEPAVARTVVASLPHDHVLFVGSSMPIRDVDAFADRDRTLATIGNRGANGIDGGIATSVGAAIGSGHPVTALIGDVAAAHDIGSLLTLAQTGAPVTIVVIHNDGGGIFHFLDYAAQVTGDVFERHFATPHGLDFVTLAGDFGIPAARVADSDELAALVAEPGPRLIEIRTDRAANLALHREVVAALRTALG